MESDNKTYGGRLNWLQRVQEQSWEPEILISGIILFALFQIPPYIEEAMFYLENYSLIIFSGGTIDNTLGALLLTANIWLIIGFTTHLISRSIWVAFVGLSYVYKDGIVLSNLKYGAKFKKAIAKDQDYDELVRKLEKFCSGVFAVSFLLFMCIVGLSFFLMVLAFFLALALEFDPNFYLYSPYIDTVITSAGLVYLIDFVTLGSLKRIPVFSKIYYPFYVVMSFLTLSPLYRSIYYGIVTNHKPWKVGLGMLAFALISFVIGIDVADSDDELLNTMELAPTSDSSLLYHGHYLNLAGDDPSRRIQIPADVVTGDVLKVFIVHRTQYEESSIIPNCDYSELSQKEDLNLDSLKMDCLSKFYSLKIDGKEMPKDYLFHQNQLTRQSGLNAYIDISALPKGMHKLELFYQFENEQGPNPIRMAIVEFYRIANNPLDHGELKDQKVDQDESIN